MLITQSDRPTKVIDFFDLTFLGGIVFHLDLDFEEGDTIDLDKPDVILVVKARKQSPNDPTHFYPKESSTFPRTYLIGIQHRQQEIQPTFTDFIPSTTIQ